MPLFLDGILFAPPFFLPVGATASGLAGVTSPA